MVKSEISNNPMKKIWIIVFILLLGISLRLYNLGKYSFWFDEALGILQARDLRVSMIEKNTVPPLYIFFLHYWNRITDSEFGLRLPSLIFGSISILMTYLLGKLLFAEKVGLISAFLLAISPFHIYYSQEARMYSMVVCFTLFSIFFLIKSLRERKLSFWLGYIIFNLLNIYLHYIGLFIWLAQNIFFLLFYRKSEKNLKKIWLSGNLLILFFFLPWLTLLFAPLKNCLSMPLDCYWIPFWPPSVSLQSLFMTFKNFSIGYNATRVVYLSATTIFFFLFIKGIFVLRKQKSLILSLLCLFVPILGLFIISKFKSVYVDRYFIASSLFYYLIIAGEIGNLRKRWIALNLSVIFILSVFSLKNYYNNFLPRSFEEHLGVQRKKEHRSVAKYINEKFQEGDGIYHTCHNTIFPFIYYSDRLDSKLNREKNKNIRLSLSETKDRLIPLEFDLFGRCIDRSGDIIPGNHKRIWLIFSFWDFEKIKSEGPESAVVKWLNENYKNIDRKEFDGTIVYLYEKKENKTDNIK
jgi:4-amino-4-deoxy-L-arabinose transferase-like glycosyltransferase